MLYVANAVLSLLSITLNYQPATQDSSQIAPVVTFRLYGIAGSKDTQIFLFILQVVVNVVVMFVTFAILFLRKLSSFVSISFSFFFFFFLPPFSVRPFVLPPAT